MPRDGSCTRPRARATRPPQLRHRSRDGYTVHAELPATIAFGRIPQPDTSYGVLSGAHTVRACAPGAPAANTHEATRTLRTLLELALNPDQPSV